MMHKAWGSIEEVLYCFSRSSVKLQGHTGQKKFVDFDPNWVFPDFNSSLNSLMDLKWCTKLDVLDRKEVPYYFSRSSMKFHGHRGWKMDDLNSIWVRLLGWSQLSNPSDLPCLYRFNILINFITRLIKHSHISMISFHDKNAKRYSSWILRHVANFLFLKRFSVN